MKKITNVTLILVLFFFHFSCKKEIAKEYTNQKKIVIEKELDGNGYSKFLKRFTVDKKVLTKIKYKQFIYNTLKINGTIDTITFYSFQKVVYRNKILNRIDTKLGIRNDGEKIMIGKYYLPHKGNISADNYGEIIFYISDDGILASFSTTSDFMYIYEPNKYSNFHKIILDRKSKW